MIIIGLLLLWSAIPALSQNAPGRDFFPWWDTPVTRDLNLSEEQHRQIQQVAREYRDKLIDLRANMEKADNAVTDMMDDDRPEQQKLFTAIDRLVTARGELTRTFTQMAARMRLVLNTQQWRELQRRRPRPQLQGQPGQPGVIQPRPMRNNPIEGQRPRQPIDEENQ